MSYENISPSKFKEFMKDANSVMLDVRTPEEEVEGTIPGSVLININDPSFPSEIEKLDKSKTYLVYCRSGNRSGKACGYMGSKGFDSLYNLDGGIRAWNEAER